MNHQAAVQTCNLHLSISVMVIVASIFLRFHVKVGVGGGTFLLNPTPPKIPSDSDSTALVSYKII
jgi:hypothetical protein